MSGNGPEVRSSLALLPNEALGRTPLGLHLAAPEGQVSERSRFPESLGRSGRTRGMTQPAWQRRARELLPDLLPDSESARSLHDLLLDLLTECRRVGDDLDLTDRAFRFVDYCLDASRARSVRIDAVDGFVRYAVVDPLLREQVVTRLFRHATVLADLLPERLPLEHLEQFQERVRQDPRWTGTER